MGLSIRRPHSGWEGVCPVRIKGEELSDADFRTFDVKKLKGFFEIYGVSARTGGRVLSQCGQGKKRSIFRDCCGRRLWTGP